MPPDLSPILDAIASRCGFSARDAARFSDGSLPVYAVGEDRVLKLFPRHAADHAATERAALALVHDALPIPTPRLEAHGEVDGWSYVLMTRLRGRSLAVAWPEIAGADRVRLAGALGEAMRALHDIRVTGAMLPALDWATFVARQRETARARQEKHGLSAVWLHQIDEFLARIALGEPRPALLHTEIMREHLLVEPDGASWRLSGLFDFEPAMIGAPEYELSSVGLFVTCGDASLFRALLLAYGCAPGDLGPELSRRVLANALLHRYSKLPWYFERVPVPAHVTTLDALATAWFGTRAV